MNKYRRQEIAAVIELVQGLTSQIDDVKAQIESIRDEEQEYYDNMPESLKYSDRGYAAEAAIGELDDAMCALVVFVSDSIISALETAAE